MDQTMGQDSVPVSGSLDKSRVWDVKRLRQLVPVFPSASNSSSSSAPPFVFVPPFGSFPSEASPFYPFSASVGSQGNPEQNASFGYGNPVTAAVPITSFRTPPHSTAGGTSGQLNGDSGPSRSSRSRVRSQSHGVFAEVDEYSDRDMDTSNSGRRKNKLQKKTRSGRDINVTLPDFDVDSIVNNMLSSFSLTEFDTVRRTDGDRESVGYILLMFDLLRRKLSQIEDVKETNPGVARRPDLRVGTILMNKGIRTNIKKRIGAVPGVEVGDIFFFRMELCLVGLHHPIMAGIGYMGLTVNQEEESVAVSVVSSGGYEDNVEDGDVLIYSGQGGNVNRKDKEVTDQKLERGNLALEKSLHRGNEVRVIRGVKDLSTPTGKIYVYDGLYKIQESWMEKGKSGCNVFKYKFIRVPGQPEAFKTWRLIQQWKDGISSRVGVILPDLTSGAENIPVSLVNDVDDEKGPAHFTYFASLKYAQPVNSVERSGGCDCRNGCLPDNQNCPCIQKNAGYIPYTSNGALVNQKSLLRECGSSCHCPPSCRNRVSQGGLRVHLEVFKTKDKGWGLRSWDPIRAGAFICEYAGEVIDISKIEELGRENADDYIFDATRTYHPVEPLPSDSDEVPKIPFPLIITAKYVGNVARFMNHSCSPNVFWQPVLRQSDKGYDLHIAFHAIGTHLPFPTTIITGLFAFLLLAYSLLWISRRQRNTINKKAVPEPGGARPLIGHLHLLGGPKPAHITLGNIADMYGPIFMIKVGMYRALIVSNCEIAKECFTTHDKIFSNRIKALAPEILGYNYAMFGFSPYGPYWRQIRKIATLEILSNHRLESLKHVRESEVKTSMKELYEQWMKLKKQHKDSSNSDNNKVLVEMKARFNAVTFNVATRSVVGKRFFGGMTKQEIEENDRCREAVRKFAELTGAFAVADAVPFLRWLDLDGCEKGMKKTAKELDQIVEGWLKEHKIKKKRRISAEVVTDDNDFMDVMISVLADAEELPSYDADTITKATCLALILGGTDTTTVTLTWALTLLLNHRDVLKKVQKELDTQIGIERQVNESDIKKLVYLQAILKETFRLYPATPLSVPHESVEDCTIAGYHVPAGTRLFINIPKIHRDPNLWENPDEFKPERFLTTHKDIDVRGQNFELMPFGSGRRGCPGISFALQVLLLTLANLLHGFEFATPGEEPLDMSEGAGLTNLKATPLEVLISPRLPAHLYG